MKKRFLLFAVHITVCINLISSCEKESKNMPALPSSPVSAPEITIGQHYGGGIVFYVDNTGQHGLITTTDNQSPSIQWSDGNALITNATGTLIGTGKGNTIAIINAQGPGNYAATICDMLEIKEYNDWFLPSKEELNLLYLQKAKGVIGAFANDFYWSSTETSFNGAWSQSFTNGANSSTNKDGAYCVRAIRAF